MEGGNTSKISFKFCTVLTPEKPTLVGLGKGRYRKQHFISSVLHEGTWFVLGFFSGILKLQVGRKDVDLSEDKQGKRPYKNGSTVVLKGWSNGDKSANHDSLLAEGVLPA